MSTSFFATQQLFSSVSGIRAGGTIARKHVCTMIHLPTAGRQRGRPGNGGHQDSRIYWITGERSSTYAPLDDCGSAHYVLLLSRSARSTWPSYEATKGTCA